MIIELPDDYPASLPIIRIKNLVQDIIGNNKMSEIETMVAEKVKENEGNLMIFEVVDALKDYIASMNDLILEKMDEIDKKNSLD